MSLTMVGSAAEWDLKIVVRKPELGRAFLSAQFSRAATLPAASCHVTTIFRFVPWLATEWGTSVDTPENASQGPMAS